MKNQRFLPAAFLLLFAAACYFPLFLHLDHMSLRLWDEARRAVNALEMAQNGNLLVTHYEGEPEMWGTKPPLLVWCQAGLMRLVGFNELAVRLPSALAALATVALLVLFCWKVLKKPLAGFLAALVLLTTKGCVGAHVARSGDFDSLLTLWETACLLAFFAFFWQNRRKWLYLAAVFAALAGLTKGIAGFFFLPGIALFALFFGFIKITSPPGGTLALLKAAAIAFLPVLGFYLLREAWNPGYLAAVLDNEVGGRYLATQGGHFKPWWHYFEWLYLEQFQPWLFWLPLGLLACFWEKGATRSAAALLLLNAVVFLLVLSFAQTKIMWYMAPVYPSLALLAGLGFEKMLAGAGRLLNASPAGHFALLAVFVLGMFGQPYRQTIERVYFEKHPAWDWHELKYRDFMRRVKDERSYTIVHARYNSHVVFYREVFNRKGFDLRSQALVDFDQNKFRFGEPPLAFEPGKVLMVCEKEVFAALDTVYRCDNLGAWETCRLLKIKEKIETPQELK